MTGSAKKTVAVSRRTRVDVMLAQTGSPPRASPQIVFIFQAAVTPHTGNGVDAILSGGRTAEVYRPTLGSSAAVTVVTAAFDIRIAQMGCVEAVPPGPALGHRGVVVVVPEAGVTLGAASLVVRSV
jgi:hypothetical protein